MNIICEPFFTNQISRQNHSEKKNRQRLKVRQTEQCKVIKINTKCRTKKSTSRDNEQKKHSLEMHTGMIKQVEVTNG